MKRNLLIILCLAFQIQIILACTFIPDSFCVTATMQADRLIVSGTITEVDDDGINLEIIEVIRGEETRTNIRVWDGTDFDCNGIFTMAGGDFVSLGDVVILMLPKIDSLENTWDVIGDFRWPDTYGTTTLLRVEDNIVNGLISGLPFPPEAGLHAFDFDLFTQYWLEDSGCDKISDTEDLLYDQYVVLFPNPVKEQINIQLEFNIGLHTVEIVDVFGKIVMTENFTSNLTNLSVKDLPQGTYFARIRKEDAIVSLKKLIKI